MLKITIIYLGQQKKNIHAIYATSFQPSKQEHNANNFTARKKNWECHLLTKQQKNNKFRKRLERDAQ